MYFKTIICISLHLAFVLTIFIHVYCTAHYPWTNLNYDQVMANFSIHVHVHLYWG